MEVPFAKVFCHLCRERRTTRLDIRDKPKDEDGKVLKRILMMEGTSFLVQGGSVNETLGQVVLAQGKISKEEYESLKKEAGGNHGKIEEKILSGAVIPAAQLPELLADQVSLKIKALFSLVRGCYEIKDQARESMVSDHVLVPLSPEKVVIEGAREYYPSARIKKEYPGIEKKNFGPAPDFKERLNGFGLGPGVLRWLRNLPESFTWDSLLKRAPKDNDNAASILLALYFADAITLPQKDADFPVGKAYIEAKAAPKAVEKKTAASEKVEDKDKAKAAAPKKKPEEKKLPVEEMLDKDMSDDDLVKEIDRLLGIIADSESTHFDLLAVEQNTPGPKIKKIYFKFAKKFHPDAHPDLYQGEVKDKVEDLFTNISDAYEILGDNKARADYIIEINSKLSKEDMDQATKAIEAEMEFQKAEVMLKRGKWSDAAELLERSVQFQPEEPEFKLYLAWANFKIKGPGEARNASRIIKKALEKRPKVADGYFYLGQISKAEGLMDEAEEYFSKAAKMMPHDVEVKRELQLIRRRRDKAAAAPKKGLFGRKK